MNEGLDEDIKVPDEFLNYNDQGFTKVNKKSGSYKKAAAKSAFIITINPNISHRTLTDINDRRRIFIQLTKLSNELEANFRAGRLLKEKPKVSYVNGKPPTLEKYKCVPEIGKQNGFIHLQGVVSFNGTTMIDTDAAREMVRKSPNGFGDTRQCKVHFRWFSANNEETMLKYIDKDYESNNASNNESSNESNNDSVRPELAKEQIKGNDTMRFRPSHTNTSNNKTEIETSNIETKNNNSANVVVDVAASNNSNRKTMLFRKSTK